MQPLVDDGTVRFLEGGSALLVGTATADGAPVATRGWGCRVVDQVDGRVRLRVLVAADDPRGIEHARPGDRVAVTATSVRTLRSVQLKGELVRIETAAPDDAAVCATYCHDFFTDIHETDGTAWPLLERSAPTGVAAWLVDAGEVFDQTPGPDAGRSLQGSR